MWEGENGQNIIKPTPQEIIYKSIKEKSVFSSKAFTSKNKIEQLYKLGAEN